VIFNPEIISQHGGFCEKILWSSKIFVTNVLNIMFNEGHCITQWGSTFQPEYGNLGILQFLVPGIPFYVTSETIPLAMFLMSNSPCKSGNVNFSSGQMTDTILFFASGK